MRRQQRLPRFVLALLPGLVLTALLFTATAWASAHATLTVDTLADGAGDCNTAGSCTLRAAIAVAASGDTITFAPALAGGMITLAGSQLTIDKSLTISSSVAITVSGGGITRVFDVAAGTVTLDGVSVTAGKAHGAVGGGLRVRSGAAVTVMNSVWFSNTTSTQSGGILNPIGGLGGAIHNAGMLTIVDSQLLDNSATGIFEVGGGDGGALYNTGVLTVINSTISNNGWVDSFGYGGGLYNDGTAMILTSSLIRNHSCGGGAILNSPSGSLTISDSTLAGNTVIGCIGGGGIVNSGALTISNSTLTSNSGSAGGGAIRNASRGNLIVLNSTFQSNYSLQGGGIDNEGALTLSGVVIANSTGGGDCDANGGTPPMASNTLIGATGSSACGLTNGVNGNIIGVDPLLDVLAYNGGPTLTHLPQGGSPVIDAGDCTNGPATDQRGVARPQDDTCDIGAVEVAALPILTVARSGAGAGSVASIPTGIDCGLTCTASFDASAVVTLTATAESGSVFAGWTGACSGSGACTVTMTASQVVTATFDVYVPPKQPAQARTMCYGAGIQVSIEPVAPAAATPGFDLVVISDEAPAGLYLTGDVQCVPYTGFASMIELSNQLVVAGCATDVACNTISRLFFGADGDYRIDTVNEVQEAHSQFLPVIENTCALGSLC